MELHVGDPVEAPIIKHQILNSIQISNSNDPNQFILDFGHLVIGNLFGIWILEFFHELSHDRIL
jgi:hypothetical protein